MINSKANIGKTIGKTFNEKEFALNENNFDVALGRWVLEKFVKLKRGIKRALTKFPFDFSKIDKSRIAHWGSHC